MAELADRLPGEIIFASYANQIRDRSFQRYVDAAARDVSEPLPSVGDPAYLTATGDPQWFNGATWATAILDVTIGGAQTIAGDLFLDDVDLDNIVVREPGGLFFDDVGPTIAAWKVNANNEGLNVQDSLDGVLFNQRLRITEDLFEVKTSGGVTDLAVTDNQLQVPRGTASDPGLSWLGVTNVGWFFTVANGVAEYRHTNQEINRLVDQTRYRDINNNSRGIRDVLIIDQAPNDTWGKNGDVAVRI